MFSRLLEAIWGEQMATQVMTNPQLSDPKLSEQKLIRAGQRGDAQAIETLFRRYQRQLFQTASTRPGECRGRRRRFAGRSAFRLPQP